MKTTELVKILRSLSKSGKHVFAAREIGVLANENGPAVGMTLIRAQKEGLVARVKSTWINLLDMPTLEELALTLRSLSYISFESALYKHGILSQSPRGGLTLATLQRSENISTPLGDIKYLHVPQKLFFGFFGDRVALPEKAYLDHVYMNIRKGRQDISETIYRDELDRKVLLKFAARFPGYVLKAVTCTILGTRHLS